MRGMKHLLIPMLLLGCAETFITPLGIEVVSDDCDYDPYLVDAAFVAVGTCSGVDYLRHVEDVTVVIAECGDDLLTCEGGDTCVMDHPTATYNWRGQVFVNGHLSALGHEFGHYFEHMEHDLAEAYSIAHASPMVDCGNMFDLAATVK